MEPYQAFIIYAVAFVAFVVIFVKTWQWLSDRDVKEETPNLDEELETADSTRQMSDISEGLEIPEEDQEYLYPIMVEVLKKLAFSKRMIPTNAMLIEHLSESLAEAAKSFEPRSGKKDPPETGNEHWLFVAAFAIRLYSEGSAHNNREALDAFISDGHLSQRRLKQWAAKLNNEISRSVREKTVGEDKAVQNITQHVETVGQTGYTQDEIDDMKDAAQQGQSGKDSAFQQSLRNNQKNNG